MSLDEGDDDGQGGGPAKTLNEIPEGKWLDPMMPSARRDLSPGLLVKLWTSLKALSKLSDLPTGEKPMMVATAAKVEASAQFGDLKDNFGLNATGYLFLEKDDNIVFQISSDDGSKLWIDNQMIIDNDGPHGMAPKEAEIALRAGYHPVRIEYFPGRRRTRHRVKMGTSWLHRFYHYSRKQFLPQEIGRCCRHGGHVKIRQCSSRRRRAFTRSASGLRPHAGAPKILPKVAGMDFLPDGRLVVSTWDASGAVYLLEGVDSGDPKKIKVKRIAQGLAEPLGVKVVDGVIYVLQKQELTKLVDKDGDDQIDEYQCFAKGWLASANFHEFAFGLAYKDGGSCCRQRPSIPVAPARAHRYLIAVRC